MADKNYEAYVVSRYLGSFGGTSFAEAASSVETDLPLEAGEGILLVEAGKAQRTIAVTRLRLDG